MAFSIQRINRQNFQILSVGGYMGNDECARLEAELDRLMKQRQPRVIVDLAALTFVTSASLSRLAKCVRLFGRFGGEFKLAGLSPRLASLVQLAGLEETLVVLPNLATAIKSLSLPSNIALTQHATVPAERRSRASNNPKVLTIEPS